MATVTCDKKAIKNLNRSLEISIQIEIKKFDFWGTHRLIWNLKDQSNHLTFSSPTYNSFTRTHTCIFTFHYSLFDLPQYVCQSAVAPVRLEVDTRHTFVQIEPLHPYADRQSEK